MLSAPVEGDAIVEEYARNGGGSVALEVKAGREFHVLVSCTVGRRITLSQQPGVKASYDRLSG